MAYVVGQYNHSKNSGDDESFINLIVSGTATRYQESSSGTSELNSFKDECLKVNNLSSSEYYYFKCQIKRLETQQIFNLKLINFNNTSADNTTEQYIKTITIQGGKPDEWVNVECIFHPIIQFDTILFQLQRTLEDYRETSRFPKIAYQELGTINNLITSKIRTGINLLKIGVQSHPSLAMCINGEEIHISKTGVYELKNGILPINFFSVVNAAKEESPILKNWMDNIGQICLETEERVLSGEITREEANTIYENIESRSFLDTEKTVVIDAFTLDYMYEE